MRADLLVVVAAVAAASGDVAAHHTNHTLNNLLACLIAADILQVGWVVVWFAAGWVGGSQGSFW